MRMAPYVTLSSAYVHGINPRVRAHEEGSGGEFCTPCASHAYRGARYTRTGKIIYYIYIIYYFVYVYAHTHAGK